MPSFLASAAASHAAETPWFSLSSASNADDARRLSSMGCSTSGSGGGGSTAAWRAAGRGPRLRTRRLPLASMSLQEAGGAAAAGPGHLRWQHSSSSSASSSAAAGAAEAPAAPLPTAAELEAAAAAATAPDVFQRGQVLGGGRYQLLRKLGEGPDSLMEGLGEGRFATVWLGRDAASGKAVVLKLLEAGDAVSYTAGTREAALHAMAGRHPNVVALLDAFEHRSSRGRHACMVLEHCGTNLLAIANGWGGNDLYMSKTGMSSCDAIRHMPTLKHIAKQLLQGLEHLHSRGIAHMELSTDNVVIDKIFRPAVQLTANRLWGSGITGFFKFVADGLRLGVLKSEKAAREVHEGLIQVQRDLQHATAFYSEPTLTKATFKLVDFGRAVPFEQLRQQQRDGPAAAAAGAVLPPRPYNADGIVVMGDPRYRPPEELLGLAYQGPEYDLWRLGCLMYKLAVGAELFESTTWAICFGALAHDASYSSFDFNDMHLLEMANVLGDLPRDLIRSSPVWSRYFNAADQLRVANKLSVTRRPGSIALPELLAKQCDWMEQAERQQFSDFLKRLLTLDPAKRAKASDMLQHKWLQDAPSEGSAD